MTFLNPLVLIGLTAASIPVILHLLNLRKLKTVEFSTVRFLKELQKTKIRKLKLKQILLLILRTLIIIFAVFAFSRPTIKSSLPLVGTYAKSSIVILLDNSFSMDVSDEFGNWYNQAKNSVLSILNSMKEGDEATIITMADTKNQRLVTFSRNIPYLKQELTKMKISNNSANLENSLRMASLIIDESRNINKEVFVVSDAQKNTFLRELNDSLKLLQTTEALFYLPVGMRAKSVPQNLSVDSINVLTRIFQKDKLVETEARIKNNSNKDMNGVVVSLMFNNDRVSQRSFDIPAGETKTINIAAEPKSYGLNKASVELENDALEMDNHRHFGFIIPDKPSVAVVGSQDKTRFISFILSPKTSMEPPANARYFSPSEFSGIDMSTYEAIIIAGGPLTSNDFARLEQYVKNGGSLFIFADDATPLDVFNRGLSLFGFGWATERKFAENQPAGFISVDKIHPLFEGVFKGTTESKSIVESPKIYHAYTGTGGQNIIDMPGGAFLSENRHGDGKVLYCAVTPGSDWSTFPITGLFPTLIYRSIFYLSARENLGVNLNVGSSYILEIPKRYAGIENFVITDPKGNNTYQKAAKLPRGPVISFDNLNQLGLYTVSTTGGKVVSVISVNPPASESDLNTLSKNDILNSLKQRLNPNTKIEIIDDTQNTLKYLNRARTGTELWQLFLTLSILCAVAEMLVAKNTKREAEGA